jgi:hypothetical protein
MAIAALSGCSRLPFRSKPAPVIAKPVTVKPAGPFKPYSSVITASAKTRFGLFLTHLAGDTLYFEIPAAQLNRDMLLVGRFARASAEMGRTGEEFTQRVLRWQRQGNRILLRSVTYEITADSTLPIYRAVNESNYPPVVAIFPIETFGADSAPVIDVTRLYTTNVPEFVGARGNLDERRSFIEHVSAFPNNVEIEATQTATPEADGRTGPIPALSIVAHWSMIRLPDPPMRPRTFDERVGYYSVSRTDFGVSAPRAPTLRYITRFRLEKKNPASDISDPVTPIIFYIDRATPAQWVPWIKKGVAEWSAAFRAAGFSNAILAEEAPSPAVDPDWSPEDVRYNVIRWVPATLENATGPHVHDPRSGEILNASISLYHNMLNLTQNWYFTQVGSLDSRARTLPFPDSLMGRLVQYVVAHEVGHTLGLQHNMKSSSLYPLDSVRSASFVHRMGHTPSIMDYARFNYVAQPEDHIQPEDLIPRVGPYDLFAIRWGYAPLESEGAEVERRTLESWARVQDSVPWLRFSSSASDDADVGDQREAVGDADPVTASELGVRNLRRISSTVFATAFTSERGNAELEELYERLLEQWQTEMGHVIALVGGVDAQEKANDQLGARFVPVSRARQKRAMDFLLSNAFVAPGFFMDEKILRRLEPEGAIRRVSLLQSAMLSDLLANDRMLRLTEYEALPGSRGNAYPLSEMLGDLRRGLWSELGNKTVRIDALRRNVQRAFLSQANSKINGGPTQAVIIVVPGGEPSRRESTSAAGPNLDARALLRSELVKLNSELAGALPRAVDAVTRAHLLDSRAQVDRILNPRR